MTNTFKKGQTIKVLEVQTGKTTTQIVVSNGKVQFKLDNKGDTTTHRHSNANRDTYYMKFS